jgi:hypothetical protein
MKKTLKSLIILALLSSPFLINSSILNAQNNGTCQMEGDFVEEVFYCPLMGGETACVASCSGGSQ